MARIRERKQDTSREASEFVHDVLDMRRTARVVAGGRRFSFRAVVAVGNKKGSVGVGVGRGPDAAGAVQKGVAQAKKALIAVPLTAQHSIPHEVSAKFAAARVLLKPAGEGRGLRAGGPIRVIAELAGMRNLTAKIRGRTVNKLNNARAVMEALKTLKRESRTADKQTASAS